MSQELHEISTIRLKVSQLEKENEGKLNIETEISKFHLEIKSIKENIKSMNYDNEVFDLREQIIKLG